MIYFISTENPMDLEAQARVALPHLDGETLHIRQVERGPSGGPGAVISLRECKYSADRQEWREFPGLWLGWEKGKRPGPDQLKRPRQYPGHWTRLGDDLEWYVPAARLATGLPGLEQRMSIGKDGEIQYHIMDRFRDLWDFAAYILDRKQGLDGAREYSDREAFDLAARAIGVNYYVGPYDASALGLLTSETVHGIFNALIDIPTMLRVIADRKKNGITTGG